MVNKRRKGNVIFIFHTIWHFINTQIRYESDIPYKMETPTRLDIDDTISAANSRTVRLCNLHIT